MTQAILFTTFVLGVLMILFFETPVSTVGGTILVTVPCLCFTLLKMRGGDV